MLSKDNLEKLLREHNWIRREGIVSPSYHKDDISVSMGPYLIIEYYAGPRDINTWLEKASVNVAVDYEELEYSEAAPYQIMFTGGYLKL